MWIIISDSAHKDLPIFLVNREVVKDKWWTESFIEARIFRVKKHAERYVNKLRFRNPRVVTYKEAKSMIQPKQLSLFE